MTEQTQAMDFMIREYQEKERVKKTFNRFGLSLVALFAVWYGLLFIIGFVIGIMEDVGISAMPFYERYMLVFNELGLALGVVVAMLVLKPLPKYEIAHAKIGGKAIKYFAIAMAIGVAGNLIGQLLLKIWNGATGNEAGGEVDMILSGSNYAILFLMVGVFAPFLEEFLFRKLLIDHIRPFGDMTCILMSGLLFGLFHGNFTQFFYAFGLGALFAYIYLKSGNFFVVFAFHAVFNIVSGILPMMILESESDLAMILFSLFEVVFLLVGIVFFIMGIVRFKPKKGDLILSKGTMVKSVIGNLGMIVAALVMLTLMVISLFAV